MRLKRIKRRLLGQSPHPYKMVPGTPVLQPDRSGIAVAAVMKDEARHVEDWIRFHHLAGVDHFFLYDDGSSDGSGKLAQALGGNRVTVVPWKLSTVLLNPHVHFNRQVLAYCHAIENFGGMFRWMAFIDIDEYIVPKRKSSIPEVLDSLESFTNISLPWTMFGPNDHQIPPDLPAPFAYTQRAAAALTRPLLQFKCIVDPSDVTEVRVHTFRTRSMQDTSVNDVGGSAHNKKRWNNAQFLSNAELQLNHYYTRSHEELHEKYTKGDVAGFPLKFRKHQRLKMLELIERTTQEDLSAPTFLARKGIADPDAFRATCVDEGTSQR